MGEKLQLHDWSYEHDHEDKKYSSCKQGLRKSMQEGSIFLKISEYFRDHSFCGWHDESRKNQNSETILVSDTVEIFYKGGNLQWQG